MIFLHQAKLVILSQPKTGTTAMENALSGRASIATMSPTQLKHMRYPQFMTYMAPLILAHAGLARSEYEVVSVVRNPVDWLGSWYRYRTRERLKDAKNKHKQEHYSGNVSFDEFVLEVLKPKSERARYANAGSPCSVALKGTGAVGCDRIFPYEDLSGLYELVEKRTKRPLELERLNVSPEGDISISDGTLAKLREKWAFAFDLHESLTRDGTVEARFKTATAQPSADDDDEDDPE